MLLEGFRRVTIQTEGSNIVVTFAGQAIPIARYFLVSPLLALPAHVPAV